MIPQEFNNTHQIYHSLSEIRLHKLAILKDIQNDGRQMSMMWEELFHQPSEGSSGSTTKRIAGLLSIGTTVLDGAILGWKLFRKFKR